MADEKRIKHLRWVGSSKKDIQGFPEPVKHDIGYALLEAQYGGKAVSAKPLQGFRGAGVLEVVENFSGDTYRAVYTVRFEKAVYVLHCFQKKSKHGVKTPQKDIELIKRRLKAAEEDYTASIREG